MKLTQVSKYYFPKITHIFNLLLKYLNNVSVYFLAGELTAFESTVDETEAEEFRVAAALLMSAAKETSTQEKPVENGE